MTFGEMHDLYRRVEAQGDALTRQLCGMCVEVIVEAVALMNAGGYRERARQREIERFERMFK